MPESANVKSIDAVKRFQAAVLQFQEDARLCMSALELQLQKIVGWLERDRPGFWKREIEKCYREMGEARIRLHQCQMRKVGDFRPTCFEERKALEKAKKDLEFAQKQVPVVKYWNVNSQQEANEFHGRASQMTQILERELPRLLALLREAVDRLEAYGNVTLPNTVSVPQFINSNTGQPVTESDAAKPDNELADSSTHAELPQSETPETESS